MSLIAFYIFPGLVVLPMIYSLL